MLKQGHVVDLVIIISNTLYSVMVLIALMYVEV